MNESLKNELLSHAIETLEDREGDSEDLHHYTFNESYYLIGTWNCLKWLEKHEINAFDAIAKIVEWQEENFGEVNLTVSEITEEKIANLYAYIKGGELLAEFDLDSEDLLEEMKAELS